jgi:pilus assembly protein CpaE
MRVFIVSDNEPATACVRGVLLREGLSCPPGSDASLDLAVAQPPQPHPDLLVVVLSPEPERVLACLDTLRSFTQARILVVGPTDDSRLVLRALRAGADDYVAESELDQDLPAALERSRKERAPQEEAAGRAIAVLAPSGGSGSSTLAANIATVLAKEHRSSLLIDLKLETGDLAALLDLKPTHTLAELCLNAERMDRVMFERSLVRHASGVHLLAPPHSFADIGHVTGEGVAQALHLARSLFPYVVVDLDHSFREEQVQVLRQADLVLLVLRLDFTALRNARRALEYLGQLGVSRDRLRLVVNRYGQPKEVPAAKAEEALGVKIFHYVPDDPKTINRANNNGVPAVLESPSARVSKSLTRLSASINGLQKAH